MSKEEVKQVYQEFKKRFNLPDFELVNKELEISSLDGDEFLLRNIRNKIKSKLENYCNAIEDLLSPDTSISLLHECSYLSENDKKKLFNLYKRIMYAQRGAELLELVKENKSDAKYINDFFKSINNIKDDMVKFTKSRMNSWKKELSIDIKEEYFG